MGSASTPHPSRCAPDRPDYEAIVRAHDEALARGDSSYRDPSTDFLVMTRSTLLARGTCCEQGCRHCPYLED